MQPSSKLPISCPLPENARTMRWRVLSKTSRTNGDREGAASFPTLWRCTCVSVFVLLFIILWQAVIWVMHLESWLLPSPYDVITGFGRADTQAILKIDLWPTVDEALIGFALAVAGGVALAAAMNLSRLFRTGMYPLLIASQAVPTIAIAAVLVVLFGYGLAPKVVVVFLFCFFSVTVNVDDAIRDLDPELPQLLRTLGASRWYIFRVAGLPSALPGLFTGARLAATYCVAAAVYGEWVGATGGLGYGLQMASYQNDQTLVFDLVLVMALLGIGAFTALTLLERLCIPWAPRQRS